MKFTVVIPIYNSEKYLEECLQSILAQEEDYEIICINDGSIDSSAAICDSYEKAYPNRVRAFHIQNSGPFRARRVGIEHATGEYICFVDSDDTIAADYFSTLKKTILQRQVDAIIFGFNRVNDEMEIMEQFPTPLPAGLYDKSKLKEVRQIFVDDKSTSLWTKCINTTILKHADLLDCDDMVVGEDFMQLAPVFDKAKSFSIIDQQLYNYRYALESLTTSKMTLAKFQANHTIYQKKQSCIKKWGISLSYEGSWGDNVAYTLFTTFAANRFDKNMYTRKERISLMRSLKKHFQEDFESDTIPRKLTKRNIVLKAFYMKSEIVFELLVFWAAIIFAIFGGYSLFRSKK